jgi:mono/diheme cytochrome c family protein
MIVLGVGLSACACAPVGPKLASPPTPASIEAGWRVAATRCAGCHAIEEGGESKMTAAPPFRTLAERYPITALRNAFEQGILEGHRHMPQFRLNRAEADALVDYLESIQRRRGA